MRAPCWSVVSIVSGVVRDLPRCPGVPRNEAYQPPPGKRVSAPCARAWVPHTYRVGGAENGQGPPCNAAWGSAEWAGAEALLSVVMCPLKPPGSGWLPSLAHRIGTGFESMLASRKDLRVEGTSFTVLAIKPSVT